MCQKASDTYSINFFKQTVRKVVLSEILLKTDQQNSNLGKDAYIENHASCLV